MRQAITILAMAAISMAQAFSQTAMPDAIIELHETHFEMASPESGTCSTTIRKSIMSAKGCKSGGFVIYTDSFRDLSSFSGEIISGGKVIRKIKLSDLTKVAVSSGLADDTFRYSYSPSLAAPYKVEYRYKTTYRRGVASFPTFFPVTRPNVWLESGICTLSVPEGTDVRYSSATEPDIRQDGKKTTYSWTVSDCHGFTYESMMPDIRTLLPYVYSCPADFSLGGRKGSQTSWAELGDWLYSLQKDTKALPEDFCCSIREMTSGAETDYEKVRIIYDYLRRTTRYVSIQLGIGGLKPFPASTVMKSGFGDCKALSNYMQAMLNAAGIRSEYLIVNTSEKDLLPGYASLGQMDHAMLCVPMESDSLWIECTNPSYPLGYRHSSIAGHEVVLVTPEGGRKVRVREYDERDRMRTEKFNAYIHDDGMARCEVERRLSADNIESYIGFDQFKPEMKRKRLVSRYRFMCNEVTVKDVSDNFGSIFPGCEAPEIVIAFNMDVPSYAKVSGDRMFIPTNPSGTRISYEKTERTNPVCIEEGYGIIDTVTVHIPERFAVEYVPEDILIESAFGRFEAFTACSEDRITTVHSLRFNKGEFPKESYPLYRDFAKSVSKAYESRIVLVRKK